MAYFDLFEPAQFGGLHFPISSASIHCSLRHHVHSYPHTPGGALEKIGRNVWTIRMTPVFDESIRKYDVFNNGLLLYPDVLNSLQNLFEGELTLPLTVPSVGTFPACMTAFSRSMSASLRSGEMADLEFVEDQSKVVLLSDLWERDAEALPEAGAKFRFAFEEAVSAGQLFEAAAAGSVTGALRAKAELDDTMDLFDALDGLANSVFAVIDQGELLQNRAAAKLESFKMILQRAQTKIRWMQRPENWRVVEAAKELESTAESLRRLLISLAQKRTYIVPRVMSIQEVSIAIYQSADRSLDIMRMNEAIVEQWSAIPAGTEIKYTVVR